MHKKTMKKRKHWPELGHLKQRPAITTEISKFMATLGKKQKDFAKQIFVNFERHQIYSLRQMNVTEMVLMYKPLKVL